MHFVLIKDYLVFIYKGVGIGVTKLQLNYAYYLPRIYSPV